MRDYLPQPGRAKPAVPASPATRTPAGKVRAGFLRRFPSVVARFSLPLPCGGSFFFVRTPQINEFFTERYCPFDSGVVLLAQISQKTTGPKTTVLTESNRKEELHSMDREAFRALLNLPEGPACSDGLSRPEHCPGGADLPVRQGGAEAPRSASGKRTAAARRPGEKPRFGVTFGTQARYADPLPPRQDALELIYVYEGGCSAAADGARIDLHAGDLCITEEKALCLPDPVGGDALVLNCLFDRNYFTTRFLRPMMADGPLARYLSEKMLNQLKRDRYLLLHTADNARVRELFEAVFCEYQAPGVCAMGMADHYMTLLFLQAARCYQAAKERECRAESRVYLTEVLRYVEDHCADCALEETAAMFHFHPGYLSRAVKKVTGYSFKELVDLARLREAAYLLGNSDLPIHEISIQCGWSNIGQFYKKFAEEYGCMPKEYRAAQALPVRP